MIWYTPKPGKVEQNETGSGELEGRLENAMCACVSFLFLSPLCYFASIEPWNGMPNFESFYAMDCKSSVKICFIFKENCFVCGCQWKALFAGFPKHPESNS